MPCAPRTASRHYDLARGHPYFAAFSARRDRPCVDHSRDRSHASTVTVVHKKIILVTMQQAKFGNEMTDRASQNGAGRRTTAHRPRVPASRTASMSPGGPAPGPPASERELTRKYGAPRCYCAILKVCSPTVTAAPVPIGIHHSTQPAPSSMLRLSPNHSEAPATASVSSTSFERSAVGSPNLPVL